MVWLGLLCSTSLWSLQSVLFPPSMPSLSTGTLSVGRMVSLCLFPGYSVVLSGIVSLTSCVSSSSSALFLIRLSLGRFFSHNVLNHLYLTIGKRPLFLLCSILSTSWLWYSIGEPRVFQCLNPLWFLVQKTVCILNVMHFIKLIRVFFFNCNIW